MTPETKARQQIDQKLEQAGWVIQDMKQLNLGAALGVAVREYPTDTGPADYVLFVNRNAVGVIEAKKDSAGENLTVTESQTERYANATLKWRKYSIPLRFLFEATGQIIRFTDGADPVQRSREIFHFFKPETLTAWLAQPETLRRRLTEQMPALPERNLRDCQISAVTGLEKSLAMNKPRALVYMATGAGKTFTAITSVYRLLKFGGAMRILFLVDTRNLGKQAHQEFMAYTPPDDGRKFTELYNVQRLASPNIDPHSQVCISTIQRMYSILSGEPIDESAEDVSLNEVQQTAKQEKFVRYNAAVPVETFDFIIIDECHRSIYNLWKQVLDYFDASLIGLTATPDKRTFGFFNENIVAEYTYEQSVADGVNVGYDVFEIQTEITSKGAELKAKEWVDHRDRATRKRRWGETEEDTTYTGKELDKSVVNVSQIRQVIQAMKTAVETQIFPTRKETPKTLIFAKTDSHADDIIQIVREVYGQGNAFCKKVTYRAEEDADSILSSFRNDYNPRIAVTVDMIATGTDVKPLEVLLFMRDVRSKGYYEQMKGRGVRSLDGDNLKRVSNSADGAKTRFVLIDAVGVEKSLKTESRPLEKKPGVPLKDLLQGVAMGSRDDDTVLSLANRLVCLAKQLDDKAQARIEKITGGIPVGELGKGLIAALDPDAIMQTALATAKAKGITRSEDTLLPAEIDAARAERVAAACAPFDKPELRDEIDNARLLLRLVQSQRFVDEMSALVQGALYPAVRPKDIAAFTFDFETPAQQIRIVAKLEELLSDLDAGMAELKAAQKKLAQYRQSLLKAAVEGALTAEWRAKQTPAETGTQLLQRILTERRARWEAKQLAKFAEQGKTPPKDWQKKYPEPVQPDTTGLPELPEGWFYCQLETLISSDKAGTKTGPFGSLLKKNEHKPNGIPVIGIENIDRMKFILGSKIHISQQKADKLSDYDLLPDDVVISRSGTVGEVCVIPHDLGNARFSTNIMRVRLECQVMKPKYFCLLLNGSPFVLNQIRLLCSGSTRDFLNTEILKTLIFPIPTISEQNQILTILDTALAETENQLLAIQLSLKQSAAQRKNILKAAFCGQLVPQDPNDEPAEKLLERIRAERAVRAPSDKTRKSKPTVTRSPPC